MSARTKLFLAGFIILAAGASWLMISPMAADDKSASNQNEKEKPSTKKTALQTFMRKKLESSQKILEGLAVEDFDLIQQGAKQLKGISAGAEFVVSKDQLYTQHADDFRRIADRLERAGKEKRLDGSALAYVDLTLSCIECHRFVRTVLIAQ